ETMLQLLQLVEGYENEDFDLGPSAVEASGPEMMVVDGGEHEIGAPAQGFAYDNERARHAVELATFEIDRTPVSNGAYLQFMEETGAEPPLYWERDDGGWALTTM